MQAFPINFAKATATGDQNAVLDAAVVTAMNDAPWAMILFTGAGGAVAASGTWSATPGGTVGPIVGLIAKDAAGAITQYACAGGQIENGLGTSNANRRVAAAAYTNCNLAGTDRVDEATFVSLPDGTHMRLNWGANGTGVAAHLNGLVLTGLTNAAVALLTTPAGTGAASLTGLAFSPDAAVFAHALGSAVPQSNTAALFGFGVANAALEQWATSIFASDAATPGQTSRWQQTDACILAVGNAEATDIEAAITSMNADGLTVNFSTNSFGAGYKIPVLCLDGLQTKIGAFAKISGTGTQTVTPNQNFVPKGALFCNADIPNGWLIPAAEIDWGIGVTDGTTHLASAIAVNDNGTTNAKAVRYDDACIVGSEIGGGGGFTLTLATVTALALNSFDLNWSAGNSTLHQNLYMLVGDALNVGAQMVMS